METHGAVTQKRNLYIFADRDTGFLSPLKFSLGIEDWGYLHMDWGSLKEPHFNYSKFFVV